MEEQLKILWTTTDAAARKAADEWLTKFQSSYEAWAAGIALVASGSTEDTKLFGATVLSTKLRSGGADSLPGEAAEHMLEALLGQIKGREPGRLRAQLARASASLVSEMGRQIPHKLPNYPPTEKLLRSPAFACLEAGAAIEVMSLIPDRGAFLSRAEVEAMQSLMVELLNHAYGGASWPAAIPAGCAPDPADDPAAYRTAALGCALAWAKLEDGQASKAEGITLALLAEAPCFPHLLAVVGGDGAAGGSGGAAGAAYGPGERRTTIELLCAALELEPTEEVFRPEAPPAPAAAELVERLSIPDRPSQLVGERMPYVPAGVLHLMLSGTAAALGPLAATARRTILPAAATGAAAAAAADGDGPEDDEEGDYDDEGDGALQNAAASLGSTLLRKASALLALAGGGTAAGSATASAYMGAGASGVEVARLGEDALTLLQAIVPCVGHRRRAVCEAVLGAEVLSPALRAAALWAPEAHGQLLSSVSTALVERACLPDEAHINPYYLSHYLHFRETFLAEPFAQIARAAPVTIARGLGSLLAPPAAAAAGPSACWQMREAALFAAEAGAEVFLSRVLPARSGAGLPRDGAELTPLMQPLLEGALLEPAALCEPPRAAASPLCEGLLLAAMCHCIAAFAPFLAAQSAHAQGARAAAPFPSLEPLERATLATLPCLSHVSTTTAEAAVAAVLLLSHRCGPELGAAPILLQHILQAVSQPMPSLRPAQRCAVVEATSRILTHAPASTAPALLEGLYSPIRARIERALTAAEAREKSLEGAGPDGGECEKLDGVVVAGPLALGLDAMCALLRPLGNIGVEALVSTLNALWPLWLRAAKVSAAPGSNPLERDNPAFGAITPVCQLGSAAVRIAGLYFQPLLEPTVQAVVGSFKASLDFRLLDVAGGLFTTFCDQEGMEPPFALIFDHLVGHALAELQRASIGAVGTDQAELTTALFANAELYVKLLVPAIAKSPSLPPLVGLAASLVGTCRQPEPVEKAISFLQGVARAARTLQPGSPPAGSAKTADAAQELRSCLQRAVGGVVGMDLVRGSIFGLNSSLPPACVPHVAGFLGPLLHLPEYREMAKTWAHGALLALPQHVSGLPGEGTTTTLGEARHDVLMLLANHPDCIDARGGLDLDCLEKLRVGLNEFARESRGLQSAEDFEMASFDWKPM